MYVGLGLSQETEINECMYLGLGWSYLFPLIRLDLMRNKCFCFPPYIQHSEQHVDPGTFKFKS